MISFYFFIRYIYVQLKIMRYVEEYKFPYVISIRCYFSIYKSCRTYDHEAGKEILCDKLCHFLHLTTIEMLLESF